MGLVWLWGGGCSTIVELARMADACWCYATHGFGVGWGWGRNSIVELAWAHLDLQMKRRKWLKKTPRNIKKGRKRVVKKRFHYKNHFFTITPMPKHKTMEKCMVVIEICKNRTWVSWFGHMKNSMFFDQFILPWIQPPRRYISCAGFAVNFVSLRCQKQNIYTMFPTPATPKVNAHHFDNRNTPTNLYPTHEKPGTTI